MALTIREIGRCWKDVGEQRRGPVSLGINLATGSTNRLSPPISRQHTDSYLYCQVAAAAAAPEKRRDSSKKLRRIGTPVKQKMRCNKTHLGSWQHQRAFKSSDLCTSSLYKTEQPKVQFGTPDVSTKKNLFKINLRKFPLCLCIFWWDKNAL